MEVLKLQRFFCGSVYISSVGSIQDLSQAVAVCFAGV